MPPASRVVVKLLLVIAFNTFAPLALKMTAESGRAGLSMFLNPWLFAALLAMGFSFLLWRGLLSHVQVSLLHPFCALVQITVPIGAWILFDEKVEPLFFAGLLFVLAGIVLTSGAAEKGGR